MPRTNSPIAEMNVWVLFRRLDPAEAYPIRRNHGRAGD
jgi:hypothetical protein